MKSRISVSEFLRLEEGRIKLTSALNSVNSSPRQSNSMMVWGFGGEAWVYAIGAALMVAVDSRWEGTWLFFYFYFFCLFKDFVLSCFYS